MMLRVRWFRDGPPEGGVWYMDCPRVPDFSPKRRVALVIDTTDSWPLRDSRLWISSVLEELDRRLESGDHCALWLLGSGDPLCELVRDQHTNSFARQIMDRLKPYDYGSWLGDTVAGINIWSRTPIGEDFEDYLLILTDGEIHDACTVPLPSVIPTERIAMIVPSAEPNAPRSPANNRDAGAWAEVQIPWSAGALARFDRTPPLIRLAPGAGGHAVYRYDQEGGEPICLLAGEPRVQPGKRLALCFIGAQPPVPELRVGSGSVALSGQAPQPVCPTDAQTQQMRRIVPLLLARWNRQALSEIAKRQSVEVTHCSKKQTVDHTLPPNEQQCETCRGCLLVQERAFRIGPEDQEKALLFPLLHDGTVAGDLPQYCSSSRVSEDYYEVHADGTGRKFLVLKFTPKVF